MRIKILFEDRDIVVVDKPAGLLTVAAAGGRRDKTAHGLLCDYFRSRGIKIKPAVVHRLDRDTSGVMVFAKSERVKKKMMSHWDEIVVERLYVAVTEVAPADDERSEGVIDLPLLEPSGAARGGRVLAVKPGTPGAKAAVTRWKLLEKNDRYALLELALETGRRNQIRAHLAALHCPVAGDAKYGATNDPLKRLCLHARLLAFKHPSSGETVRFEVPTPGDFFKLVCPK